MSIVRIYCKTQSYDWGKLGSSSKVATLAVNAADGFQANGSTPYAELWMGTHPNAPSTTADAKTPLKDALNAENLSTAVHSAYGGDLPFLFKVLSINKALSIQAHPDKQLAQELFQNFPKIYKDSNHKPEMAIALTPFEAFINFKPLAEIAQNLTRFPEFRAVVGEDAAAFFEHQFQQTGDKTVPAAVSANKQGLKSLFKSLMEADSARVEQQLRNLVARLGSISQYRVGSTEELVLRLDSQFPSDIGCFCALVLNYVCLQPGEAIFLAANEPHAYLSGDCVECMASSDNVVRSGLTPKFKDVPTLVRMLTYNYGPADAQILRGDPYKATQYTRLYDPPIAEFSILKTQLQQGQTETFEGIAGPSILIVTSGGLLLTQEGHEVAAEEGSVFFIPAGAPVAFLGQSDSATAYRAFCVV
ncbi:mannose-6-phosphate isomerase [Polychytrium aggregatum]|uniref:mannose-6-phosphate isomerase n=1 Tax=Polychytrium aggregatum TaxID=110093 RepID=UPI0022FDF72F|nr:mannose-6-phosphate isomerase [Polychytrium aggregatum]KAI9206928.1 mannose-6-phosphate isomerase [Polychytrium aggregatum]